MIQASEQKQQRTNMFIQISRVHRKRNSMIQEEDLPQEEGKEELTPETEITQEVVEINSTLNWIDFWKRARVYPEQEVSYPDASRHISSRQRRRPDFQRQRANAYVTDTDDSDSEPDIVIQ